MTSLRQVHVLLFAAVLGLVALAGQAAVPARAAGGGQALPANNGNLTAEWWRWVYAQPAVDVGTTNTNPVLDSTGAYATAGQANGIGPGNKYFFLAGTFGGTVVRTVTVPAGKGLLVPVLNIEVDNAVDPVTYYSVPELKALAAANIDTATVTYATYDGGDVPLARVTSPTFSYTLPAADSIYDYFGLFGPQFEGTVNPAVSDGYWGYIAPPSSGTHVVHLHGENSGGFMVDVTYNLTVP